MGNWKRKHDNDAQPKLLLLMRRMMETKEKLSRVLISLKLHRKQCHHWRATADNSDVMVVTELLCQMSVTWEVENYLDFFVIKVAPDVISMDWWKVHRHQFPNISQLRRKCCVRMLCQLLLKELSGLWVNIQQSVKGYKAMYYGMMIHQDAHCFTITEDDLQAQFSKMKWLSANVL